MAFTDQGEFEAMKTLSGRRAPCCDKNQFRAKMTVSTETVCKISLLSILVITRRNEKNGTFDRTLAFSCLPRGFWPLT